MFRSYFKIGWRNLVRNKGYAFINIAGLALSMTCGILIFTFVKLHLSFDNFHKDSDRVYRIVTELHRDDIAYRSNVPSPLGEAFRNDYTFGEIVGRVYTERDVLITLREKDEISRFNEADGIAFTEPAFFDIFNFPLLQGDKRSVLTEPNTAIITETTARKYFGDEDPIGKTFWLANLTPFTVTGILKDFPENTDLKAGMFVSWSTLKTYLPSFTDNRGWGGIRDGMKCYTLLRPNVSIEQVESIMPAYVKQHRPTSKNVHHYKLQSLADVHFNANYGGAMEKQNLWILSIIGVFLIATACVNFINLATAQALKRSKEVGVRKVLGSLKTQLFWQFIFETAIISAIGITGAFVLSFMVMPYANGLFNINMSFNPFTDSMLIYFILTLGVVVTFLAGYYPALVLAQFQPVTALKGKLTQHNVGGFNTRRSLIVSQFAISQVLIIGMIVVIDQMRYAQESDLGFDKDAIVMVATGRDPKGINSREAIKNEISRIPGVEKISLCFTAPASEDDWGNSIMFNNSSEEVNFRTSIKSADADYLSTFGLELAAGRNLSPSDTVREMLVNEAMIRKLDLKSPEDAIGKIIAADGGSMTAPIVGVVENFHDKSFHEEISPILITTNTEDYESFAVKLNLGQAQSVLQEIEKIWTQQHPDQIFQYEFLDESIAEFYKAEATMLTLIKTFSFISIFIGCLGLYGLVSFMVTQKSKEIGVRKVLGGSVANILWLFWKEFARLVVIAFLIAAPLGWWLMNTWLQNFQFQIQIGVWVFLLAIGFSITVALLTVSYQVMKAALTNPVMSLRME